MEDIKLFRGALLWLRNHYEIGAGIPEPDKKAILKTIDRLLNSKNASFVDLQHFRYWARKQEQQETAKGASLLREWRP